MIQIQAILRDKGQLADNTRKIELFLQEADNQTLFEIIKQAGKIGWFVFKSTPIKEKDLKDIPEVKREFEDEKSPSQRLRNCLYRYWEQQTAGNEVFDDFYKRQMEIFINSVKEKLN